MELIDKDALLAEIKRIIRKNELYLDDNAPDTVRFQKTGAYSVLCDLQHFLDTLEVKEVDLKKEINEYMDNEMRFLSDEVGYDTLSTIAKHFFELGISVSNKAQKGK